MILIYSQVGDIVWFMLCEFLEFLRQSGVYVHQQDH